MMASVVGIAFGRLIRAPALVFVIPAAIRLIPGKLALRTMVDVLSLYVRRPLHVGGGDCAAGVGGLRTMLITVAMAGGIPVPSLVLRRHAPLM